MLDDYRWLVSEAAEPWLAIAREENLVPALIWRLRRDLFAERAHLVIEQIELRQRAREKFTLADKMFFTRKGLEQATDERLATYKASRFATGETIADLCCGIGGDLVSLARRGVAHGVDRDPALAILAAVNASIHGLEESQYSIAAADALKFPIIGGAWHCDPDRRSEGRRATRGELFEPSLEALFGLLEQNNNAAIKLAPATEAPAQWRDSAELEWLGSRGECRQQVAWFGSLARHPGLRSATVVDSGGTTRTVIGDANGAMIPATKLGRYIFEPHAAVLAAKLTAVLCREHGLAPVSAGIAYLTGDQPIEDPVLTVFEVRELLPFDRKQLRAYCRQNCLGRLEIKKRGVDFDPERLRKEIAGDGDNEATMIVTPVAGQVRAIVSQRVIASKARQSHPPMFAADQ